MDRSPDPLLPLQSVILWVFHFEEEKQNINQTSMLFWVMEDPSMTHLECSG